MTDGMNPSQYLRLVDSSDLYRNEQVTDASALCQRAKGDGYLFFPGLLPTNLVAKLRLSALKFAHQAAWLHQGETWKNGIADPSMVPISYDDQAFILWVQRVMQGPDFRAVGDFKAIIAILETLFEGPVQTQCGDLCRIFFPARGKLSTLPHQDAFYVSNKTALWTVWVPLGECPLNLGPVAVLPGSHRQGLQPHSGEYYQTRGLTAVPEKGWAANAMVLGDVLMFDSLMIHKGCENNSRQSVRLSADYRYSAMNKQAG